jgi:hypothetical protein
MWTRGNLPGTYAADHLAPWHTIPGGNTYRGMRGIYPGQDTTRPASGGVTSLRLGRGAMDEVAPGFGYAKDPSNPLTWRGQPTIFT